MWELWNARCEEFLQHLYPTVVVKRRKGTCPELKKRALWSPSSWRGKPIRHVPVYGHEAHLREVEKTIATYPPLVFAGEARDLKEKLALASQGKAFLLQGGDCAESFAEHNPDNIRDIFRLFAKLYFLNKL